MSEYRSQSHELVSGYKP